MPVPFLQADVEALIVTAAGRVVLLGYAIEREISETGPLTGPGRW